MSHIIVSENNPAITTNPPSIPYQWINTTTGEMFVCVDNAKDMNIWQGQAGTEIKQT